MGLKWRIERVNAKYFFRVFLKLLNREFQRYKHRNKKFHLLMSNFFLSDTFCTDDKECFRYDFSAWSYSQKNRSSIFIYFGDECPNQKCNKCVKFIKIIKFYLIRQWPRYGVYFNEHWNSSDHIWFVLHRFRKQTNTIYYKTLRSNLHNFLLTLFS